MSLLSGPGHDPILVDITRSVDGGFFDRLKESGPSKMYVTPVEELLEAVSKMSVMRRRIYLAQIGFLPDSRTRLGGKRKRRRPRRSLRAIMSKRKEERTTDA